MTHCRGALSTVCETSLFNVNPDFGALPGTTFGIGCLRAKSIPGILRVMLFHPPTGDSIALGCKAATPSDRTGRVGNSETLLRWAELEGDMLAFGWLVVAVNVGVIELVPASGVGDRDGRIAGEQEWDIERRREMEYLRGAQNLEFLSLPFHLSRGEAVVGDSIGVADEGRPALKRIFGSLVTGPRSPISLLLLSRLPLEQELRLLGVRSTLEVWLGIDVEFGTGSEGLVRNGAAPQRKLVILCEI
ncbi:hypothetical protein DFJ43DRAFT_1149090 [Lentinula guzmanii]|uniref:Uncharacterized protein n=1 Tax=Lentinula guzmanii TaxID=2804957 RepID=A0AA38JXL8_9AGAR|nr:hypothetical protein DFJ43DRAFT_1149090 [Lentinula guzmanii]